MARWERSRGNLVQVGILLGVLALVALAYALQFRRLVRGKETGLLVLNLGFVSLATLISSFPFNIRYTLPGMLAFVALVAVLNGGAGRRLCGAPGVGGGVAGGVVGGCAMVL